jgi:hypothetical protein
MIIFLQDHNLLNNNNIHDSLKISRINHILCVWNYTKENKEKRKKKKVI